MVKNRSCWENICKKRIVTIDGDADVLRCLSIRGVCNYKFGHVGALTADQCAADGPCSCIEGHPLRQWRKVRARAHGKGVRRGAAAGCYCATCIGRALCSPWARCSGYRQRTTGCDYRDFCRRRGRARSVGCRQRIGGRCRWIHAC